MVAMAIIARAREREEARFNHCAFLAVFHLMLVHATIVRYVDDGLAGVWASLPM
jgi:hypothetical protein